MDDEKNDHTQDEPGSILSGRLWDFRRWLRQSPQVRIHPSLCIVNGDATDGTRNAPILTMDKKPISMEGRLGVADSTSGLYDRTMGCQVRTVREIKEGEEILHIPIEYMVTPDLVAASDAGQAVLACIQGTTDSTGFWDAFENTTLCETRWGSSLKNSPGQQVAVKILHERAKVSSRSERSTDQIELAKRGDISTRAPFLAFLIQQRFHDIDAVPVSSRLFKDSYSGQSARTTVKTMIKLPPKAPSSFSPYARTLPSSVSVPICWKRNELAVFASCIPGTSLMLEACSTTLQLVAEFSALLNAGISERFPTVFPPGVLTWERWVWAASVFNSRILPCDLCYNSEMQSMLESPVEICKELGVLVPLLDMFNHEIEENHVTCNDGFAIAHRKIRKHAEMYLCYGDFPNTRLISDYGFAQINNKADRVLMGWGLSDAVGNTKLPDGFQPLHAKAHIYDSKEESAILQWWSTRRLDALERESFRQVEARTTLEDLRNGRKMTIHAYQDLTYDPVFLSVAVVATVPDDSRLGDKMVVITKEHQHMLRSYLHYVYSIKLEKLLQNLDSGLKGHVPMVKLWTRTSQGGLNYDSNGVTGCQGWHRFFDSHVYAASMEVENHFYSMGVVSCALTLYDGQLKCLQSSIDGLLDDEKFASGVLKQLRELEFELADDDGTDMMEDLKPSSGTESSGASVKPPSPKPAGSTKRAASESSSDRPTAIKLHVGNLSFHTTPSDLYEYFSGRYGKNNVLECHIPIEKSNGWSRGFGFVAMPEKIALEALGSSHKHEVHGRVLKLAKSNSAGTSVRQVSTIPSVASDRCQTCGYRPKYCDCPKPNLLGAPGPSIEQSVIGTREPEPTDPWPLPRDRHEDYRRVSQNHESHKWSSWHRYDNDYRAERDYRRPRDRSYEHDDRYGDRYEYDERYNSGHRRPSSRREEREGRSRSREHHRSRKSSKRRDRSSSVAS